MKKHWPSLIKVLAVAGLLLASLVPGGSQLAASQSPPDASQSAPADSASVASALANSPVMFIENVGQFGEGARFQARGGDATTWLADDGLWITLVEPAKSDADKKLLAGPERLAAEREEQPRKGVNLKLTFPGSNPHPRIEPIDRLETHVSYFKGNDPEKWHADVPVWGGVRYKDLYPGIDLEVTGEGGQMVQRVVAQPGADLAAVKLRVEGAERISVDSGALRLTTAVGDYSLPLLKIVAAKDSSMIIDLGAHVMAETIATPFVGPVSGVEPSLETLAAVGGAGDLVYGTFLGGSDDRYSGDYGYGLVVDDAGATYVAGETGSSGFPTMPGAFDQSYNGGYSDVFVAKLNSSGTNLVYATFLGGSDSDSGAGIAVDNSGSAYVSGGTSSSDFPTTAGAFDRAFGGDEEAFVVKINSDGTMLAYSTLLGGSSSDFGRAIAIDSSGCAYATGMTYSMDFPTTLGAFARTRNNYCDVFVAKLNPSGGGLLYGTYLGGNDEDEGYGIAVDGAGSAYVTGYAFSMDFPTTAGALDRAHGSGSDGFVTKLNASGTALVYSTFLGGGSDGSDYGNAIAVNGAGNAFVIGRTSSRDFPTTPGAFDTALNPGTAYDAFVVKLNVSGSKLLYGTYLGGRKAEWGFGIALDGSGQVYVSGQTSSSDFPTTPGAFGAAFSGDSEAFVAKLNRYGTGLLYSTLLGKGGAEGGHAIAVDSEGHVYCTGTTSSAQFPTTPGAFDTTFNGGYDVFVVKLQPTEVVPPNAVEVSGNSSPCAGASTVFSAAVSPVSATVPLSLTWQVTDLSPVTHTTGLSDTASFFWSAPGIKTVKAAAKNIGGGASGIFTVTVRPRNDDFEKATKIAFTPYKQTSDVSTATGADRDPVFSCTTGKRYRTVWYRYTPAVRGFLTASTGGSSYGTILGVWRGAGDSLTPVACNDNYGGAVTSSVTVTATGGTTYYMEVASKQLTAGSLVFNASFVESPATNNYFDGAKLIPSTNFTHWVDTSSATVSADDPTMACIGGKGSRTLWYRYTPASSGWRVITTAGSNYDTVVAVWRGAQGSLTKVNCNDNYGSGTTSRLGLSLTGGTTYYIEVASKTTSAGTLMLRVTGTAP